jgi:hypothetical protein
MKRICVLLIGLLVLLTVPAFAQEEDDFEIRQLSDNTVKITGYKGTVKNVVIPETLYGLPVTVIGSRSFRGKQITGVVIPDSVTTIEGNAFANNDLTRVTIGKNVKKIESEAFYNNQNLSSVVIPDSVTTLGPWVFFKCGLTNLTIGSGITVIPQGCFANNKLTTLVIPEGVVKITGGNRRDDTGAFEGNQIAKIAFPASLKEIGAKAFYGNQITEITFSASSSLESINFMAFMGNKIKSLVIPEGVVLISADVFNGNPIEELVLPASLNKHDTGSSFSGYTDWTWYKGIMGGAFAGNALTRITLPEKFNVYNLVGSSSSGDLGFDQNFINFWDSQNRAAGTYVKRGPIWTKE